MATRRFRKSIVRLRSRLFRLVPERLWATGIALRLIWSRRYGSGRRIVGDVARDTGFYERVILNKRDGVKDVIGGYIGLAPGAAEDLLRGVEARRRAQANGISSSMNAMIEIAYQSYKERA